MNRFLSPRPLVDFHTHILPQMDDGSRSPAQSLQMLQECARQNVSRVVLTPHFYADRDDPQMFLARRERSLAALRALCPEAGHLLIPAAEITYFEGITGMDALPQMRMGASCGLLIEMPQRKWSARIVDDILSLQSRPEYRVVIAHIERYASYQETSVLRKLTEAGVLFQANAGFFCRPFSRFRALRMLKRGYIHLLGSDCHDTGERPPNLGEAAAVIAQKCGAAALEEIRLRGEQLLLSARDRR